MPGGALKKTYREFWSEDRSLSRMPSLPLSISPSYRLDYEDNYRGDKKWYTVDVVGPMRRP